MTLRGIKQSRTALAGVLTLMLVASGGAVTPAFAGSHAPLGYQLMCLKTPSECKGGGPSKVKATGNTLATLKRVNARVNGQIVPRNDGAVDVWKANATTGDCEDYVLAKRRALIKAGLPASSLRMAYVKTRAGEGHAILVVKTSSGDFVLDNLTATVKPLSQTGYRIISMSGSNPNKWN